MKNKKRVIWVIIVLLLGIRFCYVIYQHRYMPPQAVQMQAETPQASEMGGTQASMLPSLEESERALLEMLYADYMAGNMDILAEDIIDAYDDLEVILAKFSDGPYVYDGTSFLPLVGDDEAQTGMLFLSPSKVFLGQFRSGYPTGEVMVISAFEADVRRYDYAKGDFSTGMLQGSAEIGSINLDLPESNIKQIKKIGNFVDDLMTGDIIYSLILGDEAEVSWNIKAENGITVVDDGWIYDEATEIYKLSDNGEGIHQYEIKKDMVSEVRWRNLLTWEY